MPFQIGYESEKNGEPVSYTGERWINKLFEEMEKCLAYTQNLYSPEPIESLVIDINGLDINNISKGQKRGKRACKRYCKILSNFKGLNYYNKDTD